MQTGANACWKLGSETSFERHAHDRKEEAERWKNRKTRGPRPREQEPKKRMKAYVQIAVYLGAVNL